MNEEKLKKINQYIARVDVLLSHLDEVMGCIDDEEYIEQCLNDDMKYIGKRIKIIRDTKAELIALNSQSK